MVSSTAFFISYLGNGSNLSFAIPFYFANKVDIYVYVNGAVQSISSNYTVQGSPDDYDSYPTGGTILFGIGQAPGAGLVVLIIRRTPKTMNYAPVDQGPFLAQDLIHTIDRLEIQLQETPLGQFVGVSPTDPVGPSNVGDWYLVTPPVPGGPFARVCTAAGTPGIWNDFAMISL